MRHDSRAAAEERCPSENQRPSYPAEPLISRLRDDSLATGADRPAGTPSHTAATGTHSDTAIADTNPTQESLGPWVVIDRRRADESGIASNRRDGHSIGIVPPDPASAPPDNSLAPHIVRCRRHRDALSQMRVKAGGEHGRLPSRSRHDDGERRLHRQRLLSGRCCRTRRHRRLLLLLRLRQRPFRRCGRRRGQRDLRQGLAWQRSRPLRRVDRSGHRAAANSGCRGRGPGGLRCLRRQQLLRRFFGRWLSRIGVRTPHVPFDPRFLHRVRQSGAVRLLARRRSRRMTFEVSAAFTARRTGGKTRQIEAAFRAHRRFAAGRTRIAAGVTTGNRGSAVPGGFRAGVVGRGRTTAVVAVRGAGR